MARLPLSYLVQTVRDIILPFYSIERHTLLHVIPERRENDAEHSWSVALFASMLAPAVDPSLDVGKICQFATVHDLVEVYAGDTSNLADDAHKAGKDDREAAALQKLRSVLTATPWIAESIAAYEAQATPEARFVKSVDKLLLLLFDYLDEGALFRAEKITREEWQRKLQKHREKAATHQGVFEYYDELWNALLSHPEFFYADNTTSNCAVHNHHSRESGGSVKS